MGEDGAATCETGMVTVGVRCDGGKEQEILNWVNTGGREAGGYRDGLPSGEAMDWERELKLFFWLFGRQGWRAGWRLYPYVKRGDGQEGDRG
jgi:hypothetical protein